jgi:hypothetical protein
VPRSTPRINDLPEIHGRELAGDDAASQALEVKANYNPGVSELPGGYQVSWERGAGAIHARRPYGFPKPGRYRIFGQMKRGGQVLTGAFNTKVED